MRARRHQPRRRLAGTGLLVLTGRPFSGARHGDRVRDIAESEHALLRAARAAWAAHPGPREDYNRYRSSRSGGGADQGPGTLTVAVARTCPASLRKSTPRCAGWINYYGAFYRSELFFLAWRINEHLARWAMRKFKRFRGKYAKAMAWLQKVYQHQPRLFAHWQLVAFT